MSETTSFHGVASLPHLGVIAVTGEDAAQFLHNQLTQDFKLLKDGQARLAAFCSAQGRVQASFVALKRSSSEVLLVVSRDLLERTVKRLSMFVLRAKVKVSDASAAFELRGLAGDAVHESQRPWETQSLGETTLVHLHPANEVPRALWIAPAGTVLPAGKALAPEAWLWGEVVSGVATVTAPIFEAFVPQMLNYESLDGVNFKKGCYPGQEVVARSQYRGVIKRRAFIAHGTKALQVGQEIFDVADAERQQDAQPVGLVAQAAQGLDGQGWDAIVVLQTAAVEKGASLQADGVALELRPLPYALREDI